MRYVNFVLSKWKEKPIIAWISRHSFDIIAIIILIVGAYFLIPMIMATVINPVNTYSNTVLPPHETKTQSTMIYMCEIKNVYIKIFISDDGITYMNDKYKVSVYLNGHEVTDDLKGPYLDLQAMNSSINITAVPYDSNYEILTQTIKIGCIPDVSISMYTIKKIYVDTNWQTEGIAIIDYNKDIYYVN